MRIFGIDPGSARTGYGCVETDGSRHRLLVCGAISPPASATFPDKLQFVHRELLKLIRECAPSCVAIENVFHAANVRSALKLGHTRGVALLAASEAGVEVAEYSPAEVKRAVVGYGRAEKVQVQQMVRMLLGLRRAPTPHDVADALAVAICHVHSNGRAVRLQADRVRLTASAKASAVEKPDSTTGTRRGATSWRRLGPADLAALMGRTRG